MSASARPPVALRSRVWKPDASALLAGAQAAPSPATADELVALIAHDLRSPLNIVLMATELLEQDGIVSVADRDRWLSVIRDAAVRMDAMIGDLLEVSRLQAGRASLDPRPLALRPLLLEVMHTHRPTADRAEVALRIGACSGELIASIDRTAILRVLANLIDNAIRFTPAGGYVMLDAEQHRERIRISVRDTGTGILAEHLPHIFDRFWQAGHTRRGSAGLGLSIVKSIVEQHGGRVAVESEPGRGTCFELFLPQPIERGRRRGRRGERDRI